VTRDELIAELQKLPNSDVQDIFPSDIIGYVEVLRARGAQSDNLREENRYLRRLLVAIASKPDGIRFRKDALHAVAPGDDFTLAEDMATAELILSARKK
jgi:hypothetical protein